MHPCVICQASWKTCSSASRRFQGNFMVETGWFPPKNALQFFPSSHSGRDGFRKFGWYKSETQAPDEHLAVRECFKQLKTCLFGLYSEIVWKRTVFVFHKYLCECKEAVRFSILIFSNHVTNHRWYEPCEQLAKHLHYTGTIPMVHYGTITINWYKNTPKVSKRRPIQWSTHKQPNQTTSLNLSKLSIPTKKQPLPKHIPTWTWC